MLSPAPVNQQHVHILILFSLFHRCFSSSLEHGCIESIQFIGAINCKQCNSFVHRFQRIASQIQWMSYLFFYFLFGLFMKCFGFFAKFCKLKFVIDRFSKPGSRSLSSSSIIWVVSSISSRPGDPAAIQHLRHSASSSTVRKYSELHLQSFPDVFHKLNTSLWLHQTCADAF
jgi:hypothetical protein